MQGGYYYTSNGDQSSVPVADGYFTFGINGFYIENTPAYRASVRGSVDAQVYPDATATTYQPRADINTAAILSPERLEWVLIDRLESIRRDPLEADLPSNKERANVMITGPNWFMRLSKVDRLVLEGRYEQTNFETQTVNNSIRYGYATRWLHAFSPTKEFGLNYEQRRIQAAENYTRHDGYLSYERTSPKNTFRWNLGSTWIDREPGADITGDSYRLEWVHRSNPRNSWMLRADHRLSEIGDAIILPEESADPLTRDGGIFQEDSGTFSYSYTYADKTISLRAYQRRREYMFLPIKEKTDGVMFNYDQRFRVNGRVRVYLTYNDTYYSDTASNDLERALGIEYGRDITREFGWRVGFGFRDRASPLPGRSFDEQIFQFLLVWNRQSLTSIRP